MNLELVKLNDFSGKQASVYSLLDIKTNETLFEKFISENNNSFKSEIFDIIQRLISIGKKVGAREQFFKTKEGKPGDLVCALYDTPNSKLRLYCLRFGSSLIILGGGGHKPKTIKALQENEKLKAENKLMVRLSEEIAERIKNKEIIYTNEYMDFEGNLKFDL